MRYRLFLAVMIAHMTSAALLADTVFLRSGQTLYGQIVGQSRTEIRIAVQGQVRVIQKAEVARVQFDDDNAAKKAEEERKRQEAERARQEEARRKAEEDRARDDLARRRADEQKRVDEQKRLEDQKKLEEERRAAKAREDAESKKASIPERKRHYLDASLGLVGGSYTSGMESNNEFLQKFLITQGGTQAGALSYAGTETRGFTGLSLEAKYYWNRCYTALYGSGIKRQQETTLMGQSSGSDGQSGKPRLENSFGAFSHESVRRRADISGGWFLIYTEKLEVSVGAGYMGYTTFIKGDIPTFAQDLVNNISTAKYSSGVKASYEGRGVLLQSAAAYQFESLHSWLTLGVQMYRTKGVVTDQVTNVNLPSDYTSLESTAQNSTATGIDILPGWRWQVRSDLQVGAQMRFETVKINPGTFAFTKFTVGSSGGGPKAPDILLFAALSNISPYHKKPYRDKFSGITFSVQKRFDFSRQPSLK